VTSVASGVWSSPATWDTGVPVATDNVVIGAARPSRSTRRRSP
jgi:hypothetical protein